MKILDAIQKIQEKLKLGKYFEPQYGNYGGSVTKCGSKNVEKEAGVCPEPADDLDKIFVLHDRDTGHNNDPYSDFKMVGRLLRLNPFTTKYDRPVYGRLYQYGAAAVFTVLGVFSTPVRLIQNKGK